MPSEAVAASAIILAVSVILLLWPFVFYPMILSLLPARPLRGCQEGATPGAGPTASLLFCAYNEESSLPAKIANIRMLKARHPALDVLAFNDGSTDGSAALLHAAADVITTIDGPGRSGKARGMKTLAAKATGDVLIFTDANVLLDAEAVERLLGYYADADVGGVLGSLRYDVGAASASAAVGGLYWRIEEALKDRESATGNVMGADGSIFSIRAPLYPAFPDNVLDDLTVSMAVVFAGRRLIKAQDVIAREMMVTERSDEWRRKVRIAARSWTTHRHLRPQLRRMAWIDRFKYASRKLVRWFGAVWMATAAASALVLAAAWSPWLAIELALLGLLLLVAGWRARSGKLAALVDVVLAYAATLLGVASAMAGRDFTLWTPAKSR